MWYWFEYEFKEHVNGDLSKAKFNPDPTKVSQELIFSHKFQKRNYLLLSFNQIQSLAKVLSHKSLGMFLILSWTSVSILVYYKTKD